jgi:Flp pilus assembly pilin Flp
MVQLYLWLVSRVAGTMTDDRGLSGVEYIILVAVIGLVMFTGATLFAGAISTAWSNLVTFANGI